MKKTFKLNKKGNIELSKEELEKCLDDNFWLGYARGVANTCNKSSTCQGYPIKTSHYYMYSTPCYYTYNTPIYKYNSTTTTCCTQKKE